MATRIPTDPALLQRFQAVAEETRFRIVQLLADGERCVCELQDDLGAAQSRLSFHLKKLREAGVVSDRRDGRWVYYTLVPEALEEMRAFLGEVQPPAEWRRTGGSGVARNGGSGIGRDGGSVGRNAGSGRGGSCC